MRSSRLRLACVGLALVFVGVTVARVAAFQSAA